MGSGWAARRSTTPVLSQRVGPASVEPAGDRFFLPTSWGEGCSTRPDSWSEARLAWAAPSWAAGCWARRQNRVRGRQGGSEAGSGWDGREPSGVDRRAEPSFAGPARSPGRRHGPGLARAVDQIASCAPLSPRWPRCCLCLCSMPCPLTCSTSQSRSNRISLSHCPHLGCRRPRRRRATAHPGPPATPLKELRRSPVRETGGPEHHSKDVRTAA